MTRGSQGHSPAPRTPSRSDPSQVTRLIEKESKVVYEQQLAVRQLKAREAEMLREISADGDSQYPSPAADAARALSGLSDRSRVTISCEHWPIADRMRAWLPGIGVAYSIGSKRELRRFIEGRRDGSLTQTPVSIRESLLRSADDVDQLRTLSGSLAVWTVDDVDRALELVALGVDKLISNRLQVLNAV